MRCANCRKVIRDGEAMDFFGAYVACRSCYRELLYLTHETGSVDRTVEELAFEVSVDQRIAQGA
jgi:hypothetical protein